MDSFRPDSPWGERAAKLICLAFAVAVLWLTVRYAAPILAVFLIAWAVASVIHPLAKRTHRAWRIPQKLCAAVYFLLFLVLLGWLLFFGIARLMEECGEWLAWLDANHEQTEQACLAILDRAGQWLSRLPFVRHAEGIASLGASWQETIAEFLREAVSKAATRLAAQTASLLGALPKLLIFFAVTVMACLYWSVDYDKIATFLTSLLPSAAANKLHHFRTTAGRVVRSYLRAYLLLWLLTFGEVLIGLLILDQPYPLPVAAGIATVDLLPVLGSGTVLLPWAVVQLLLRQYSLGIGLLILYGVITVVRQIAEPHLVGGSLGLHPLASLLGMLLGFQLFGVLGMALGPLAALLVKEYLAERRSDAAP